MRYDFYDHDGVEYVRIGIGADLIDRPATKADHDVADVENAAEETQLKQLADATKERIERENENEKRTADQYASERVRLDKERHAKDFGGKPPPGDEPTQQELEKEFDKGLAKELDKPHKPYKTAKEKSAE